MRTTTAPLLALTALARLALALPRASDDFPAQAVFAPALPAQGQQGQQQPLALAHDIQLSTLGHPHLPTHRLRVKHPGGLCDDVDQTSGYVDTDRGHHHFFWQFDSRNDPSSDPVVLWSVPRRLSRLVVLLLAPELT